MREIKWFARPIRQVYFSIYRSTYPGLTLEIGDGCGGFRIGGPKTLLSSQSVGTYDLDERSIGEVRRYLSKEMRRIKSTKAKGE